MAAAMDNSRETTTGWLPRWLRDRFKKGTVPLKFKGTVPFLKRSLTLQNLWWFVRQESTRYGAAWLLALIVAACSSYEAYTAFDRDRPSGNDGHAMIDFGGQWLMGRMLMEGHGQQLYNRAVQRQVLSEHYPAEDRNSDSQR